jgi:hypothetical protein
MIMFFKKKPKKEKKTGVEIGVQYFIDGSEVIFELEGLDFTFERLYVTINESEMIIFVPEEPSMNLINILDTVANLVEVDREDVLTADIVDITLKLKDVQFSLVKSKIFDVKEIKEIFDLEVDGKLPLRFFENYELKHYIAVRVAYS